MTASQQEMNNQQNKITPGPSLIFCLFMDAAGAATLFLPGLGERFDFIWAPFSAYIFYKSFGGKTGRLGAFINLVEELLPFTDFVPTFTLGYIFHRLNRK